MPHVIPKKIILVFLLLILGLGIFARFYKLADHFGHVDDFIPLTNFVHHEQNPLGPIDYADKIARGSTYAPLQYIVFPLLLEKGLTYRELLFRSRLPSCILSVFTLVLFSFLLWKMGALLTVGGMIGLGFFAFSLQAIIYSKQSSPYSALLFGVCVLLAGLWYVDSKNYNLKSLLLFGVLTSAMTYFAYQLLVLSGLGFGALFLNQIWQRKPFYLNGLGKIVGQYFLAFFIFLLGVNPLYQNYLKTQTNKGHFGWVNSENYFPHMENWKNPFVDGISYLFSRVFIVIKNCVSFLSYESPIANAVTALVIVVIGFGLISLKKTPNRLYRLWGLFAAMVIGSWIVLNILNIMPLSPTRHTLFFLPCLCLLIVIGIEEICSRWRFLNWFFLGYFTLSMTFFLVNLPSFFLSRQDPINEDELREIARSNQVQGILGYMWTVNQEIIFRPKVFSKDPPTFTVWDDKFAADLDRSLVQTTKLLLFSHWMPLSQTDDIQKKILDHGWSIQTIKEIKSDVEVDLSRTATKNGSNNLFVYVIEKK